MILYEDKPLRKLSVVGQEQWNHHRSGWGFVLNNLYDHLHIDNGVEFIGYLDGHFRKGDVIFKDRWIGVLHNPPHLPDHINVRHVNLHSISTFLKSENWRSNSDTCHGLIVLSEYCNNYINDFGYSNTLKLYHPTEQCDIKFDIDKFNKYDRVISIGHWLRNFDYFYELNHHNKILIKPFERLRINESRIKSIEHLSNDEYDEYLSSSVVFLNLYGSSANNVIVECMDRNTPIIINKLEPIVEYLGESYPLFYNDINEANKLVKSKKSIAEATEYLSKLDKSKLNINTFINDLSRSDIYKSI